MFRLFKKVDLILSDFRPEHSEFQIENFIIGAQGNEWARYRQALRELSGRHEKFKEQADKMRELKERLDRERRRWWRRSRVVQTKAELESAKKAFKSKAREYFYRQEIAALRDSDVSEEAWDILGLLAVAVGPLSREELAGISQKPPRRVSKALTAVMRYLLGERRYELMHPRLRDLLTGEFSAAERADYTRRLLEWCARFRDGGWPEDTPEYLLDYYAAQLADAGDTAGLFSLIDRRWMERQRLRDGKGELVAFIRDVSRATAAATQDTSRDWLAAFRGTYVLATVSLRPSQISTMTTSSDCKDAY